jgi:hypothetical protein
MPRLISSPNELADVEQTRVMLRAIALHDFEPVARLADACALRLYVEGQRVVSGGVEQPDLGRRGVGALERFVRQADSDE